MSQILQTASGRRIAYRQITGEGVGIVFLGGFMSDMQGTKAIALETWAKSQGRPFLRFDYSGHGESSGTFIDGSIGDWAEDAQAVISKLTSSKQILVGSSMGGWIALLLAKRMPEKIAALVGIAAAPDFTEDSMWDGFDADQRRDLDENGVVLLPSGYGDPYPITARLIADGRENLVLRDPLPLPFPCRFLQGTLDGSVKQSVPLRILDHVDADDIRLTLIKGADHSFSTPECLAMVEAAINDVTRLL